MYENVEGKVEIPQRIEYDELLNFLPHKGKMFLLSRVTAHDVVARKVTTEYDITKDCIFYEKELDGIPTWSGFELMAQGISAFSTITRIYNHDPDLSRPGVVLSVVDFRANVDVLKNNTTVQMRIDEDYHADNVYRYNCAIYKNRDDTEPAATAKISVMEMKNMEEVLSNARSK